MLKRSSLLVLLLLLVLAGCRAAAGPTEPDPTDPGPTEPDGTHTFTFLPPPTAPEVTSVTVPGSFNGWNTGDLPMERQMDGSWQATVELEQGQHEYKFYINDAWPQDMCNDPVWGDPQNEFWIDPNADGCVGDGFEGQNAYIVIAAGPGDVTGLGFSHAPDNPAHLSVAGGRLSVRFQANQGQVQGASLVADGETLAMHRQLGFRQREVWRASVPEGTTSYRLELETAEGPESFGPFTVPADLFREVAWVGESVGYQIFPERFWNGDPSNDAQALATSSYLFKHPDHWPWPRPPVLSDGWAGEVMEFHCCHQYFGGDLRGIIDRLDYLESLGVTFLYLNPIFLGGSAHGYDTFDYLSVAPNLGDEETLRELLAEARARGMRVMWDFVPNHVGVGHWAFQDAVANGEASETWDWFRFNVPAAEVEVGNGAHYGAWWGFGSLPELETRNAEVVEHLLEVTRHWTEFGFDGIRVDVPNEVVNRREFFPAFREAAKSINPEVYLVGEIWQRSPSWLQGDEFDSLMNYAIGQAVVERFATGGLTGSAAAQEMALLYADYPEAAVGMQFNLISSHDTARLLTKLGGGPLGGTPSETALARHRLASAMLYALPGMPVTFQGDECAFLGRGEGPQEENRYPMQWDACDTTMVAHYQRLASLRGELEALRSPVIRAYHGEGPLLAFFRGEPGAGEVLAVFNSAEASRSLELPEGSWTDAGSGQTVSGSAELGGLGWRLLQRR